MTTSSSSTPVVESPPRYYRRVIHICAEDSPNVELGLRERELGRKPSGRVVLPGVLGWEEYLKRRSTWDEVRQCIGLDGRFWEGMESLLYPPAWLNRAEVVADRLIGRQRQAETIGIDPGEGGSNSCFAAIDKLGLIELLSLKTPNTTVVVEETLRFMDKHKVEPQRVYFDAGGGGKQHADSLRNNYKKFVNTVPFGESASPELRKSYSVIPFKKRVDEKERRYVYKNRRAEMYDILVELLDPAANPVGFGIPAIYQELRRQLSPIPRLVDGEGRLELPPKYKKPGSTRKSLVEIIGRSPDEADALVLACYGMMKPVKQIVVRGF